MAAVDEKYLLEGYVGVHIFKMLMKLYALNSKRGSDHWAGLENCL